MPRIKIHYTRSVRQYNFNPPTYISIEEFKYYKELINANSKVKLNAKLSEPKLKKSISVIGKIVTFPLLGLFPGKVEDEIMSFRNKRNMEYLENGFWTIVKEIVNESANYDEFTKTMEFEFPFYKKQ